MPRISKIGAASTASFGLEGFQSIVVTYLLVGGGGGSQTGDGFSAGGAQGGRGGAVVSGTFTISNKQTLSITIGTGGIGGGEGQGAPLPTAGTATTFSSFTAAGGAAAGGTGQNGPVNPIAGSTSGQLSGGVYYVGGSGARGTDFDGNFGTPPGLGGGGAIGQPGTPNTGGGGGGPPAPFGTYFAGKNGGSGVAVVSYSGPRQMTGGVYTFVNGVSIHTFNSSGSIVV
jgi:hypothetical protein